MKNLNMNTEPVALTSLITAALVATVALIALVFDITNDVVAAINIAIAAWVLVIARVVRGRVTPTGSSPTKPGS